MQRADEPTEGLDLVEVLQAVPRAIGGRHINERQTNAGDDLQDEQGEAGAAEYVSPARAAARYSVGRSLPNGLTELEARVKPCANAFETFNQTHVPPLVFPT